MQIKMICIFSVGLLFIQGCQNKQVTETTNDDWLVGSWTDETECKSSNTDTFRDDGVLNGRMGGGAWRLKNDVLTLTYLYTHEPDGDTQLRFDDNQARLKIVSHDSNRSMVTSTEGEDGSQVKWINCAIEKSKSPTFQNSSPAKQEPSDAADNPSLYDGENFCAVTTKRIFSMHDNTVGGRAKGIPSGTRLKIEACEKDTEACYTVDGEAYFANGIKKVPCN